MSNRFANGRKSFGFCDVCGFRFDLKRLKNLVVKTKETQIKACPQCWTPDQPQLQLGMFPVSDPQAIRNPRPDTNTWYQSGVNALGNVSEGMLVIQWGWNPVGGSSFFTDPLTPNTLVGVGEVGTVTFPSSASEIFTTPGTYSWVAPVGVTSVYVLCVGGGGSGGPQGGTGVPGGNSSFDTFFAGGGAAGSGATGIGGLGGTGTSLSATVFGGNGGNGANRATIASGGGGGAGGYAGNGGNGGNFIGSGGTNGSGGAGGGGAGFLTAGAGGGGVGISGQGPNGAGGSFSGLTTYGGGGSGGQTATSSNGGLYGAGGGGSGLAVNAGSGGGGGGLRWTFLTVVPGTSYTVVVGAGGVATLTGYGANGAVRINWLVP